MVRRLDTYRHFVRDLTRDCPDGRGRGPTDEWNGKSPGVRRPLAGSTTRHS